MQTIGSPSPTGLLVATALDTSPDTYRAPPRPLPYDVDPRYIRLQRDGLVSRREKVGISQLHSEESEPLRRNTGDDGEQMITIQRRNGVDYDDDNNEGYQGDSPGKRQQSTKLMGRVESVMSFGDDEDICPTCLDGNVAYFQLYFKESISDAFHPVAYCIYLHFLWHIKYDYFIHRNI